MFAGLHEAMVGFVFRVSNYSVDALQTVVSLLTNHNVSSMVRVRSCCTHAHHPIQLLVGLALSSDKKKAKPSLPCKLSFDDAATIARALVSDRDENHQVRRLSSVARACADIARRVGC